MTYIPTATDVAFGWLLFAVAVAFPLVFAGALIVDRLTYRARKKGDGNG